ncbi:hypothetical protein Y1Q_0005954 [Alligator mississippiensis]|uniref:Ig-like domain-containing protein n=1 Tax=Alligator mississippiensis TaxID=8496 RepID=A0A151MYS3_ALLMI|nr:hypothetical protein Y1Q_0005954 [Alligator mississippiensis]
MTKGVTSFPSVLTSAGSYTAATQISVSNSDWRVQQPLFCAAEHPQGNRKIKIPAFIANPVMTLHGPTTEDFEGPFRNSTVICQVKDLPTRDITLSWLRNGAPLKSGFSTTGPLLTDEGFLIISELIVTEENWKANVIYTCKVDSRGFSEVRNISKLLICDSPCLSGEIDVQLIPPSFAETYLTKAAKLTCRVINLPTADGLVVTWRRQDGKLLETTIHPRVVQPNGQYHVDATASVCADEWDKGETYICQVTYPDLIFPIEKILRRQPEARSHAPTIYVFPPPSEQLARHETATVTCLVKGFNPPDLFVRWLQNGEPMNASTYITGKPTLESQQSETYFTYSTLTIREQAWNAGNTYTCVVGHQKLPMQVAQKTIDKSTGYLDDFVDAEDEELYNLWKTASTFIVLFILSLFYGATVTLFKIPTIVPSRALHIANSKSDDYTMPNHGNCNLPTDPFLVTLFYSSFIIFIQGPQTIKANEDFDTPYRNSTITCQVKDLHRSDIALKNGNLLPSGFTTLGPVYDGDEGYFITSQLIVTEVDWNANIVYSCMADSMNSVT